jgi:hypothetical protein
VILMKFFIAALAVSAVTGVAVIAALAGDKQASTIEPVCSDSCDLAAPSGDAAQRRDERDVRL